MDNQLRWLSTGLFILIVSLSVLPSVRLLLEALSQLTFSASSPLAQVLQSERTWGALKNSFYTSGLGAFIAVILGAGFSFIVTLTNVRGRGIWVFFFMLPMMIPPQVTALSWVQLFGPASPMLNTFGIAPAIGSPQPMYSANGIALLLGIQSAPLVFLTMRTQLVSLPQDLIEAAQLAKASSFQIWLDIIFPLCRSALVAGGALAFVSSLGNFGIPAMLGIPAGYIVLPTLIYQQMAGFGNQMLSQVAGLSMIIALLVLMGMLLQQWLQQRSRYALLGHSTHSIAFSLKNWRIPLEILLATILSFILVIPLLALVVSSMVPALGMPLTLNTFTLSAFEEMISRQSVTFRAFENSTWLAFFSALVLMLVSLPLGYLLMRMPLRLRSVIASLIEVPYAIPGIVLAIAFILLFAKPLPFIGISLYGTLSIIFLAYLSCFLSVCLKPVLMAMSQLDPALEEAAQLAGAKSIRRLIDIILPLTAPAFFAGGLLVFLIAINELTVSALLWSAGNETLGVLIFNLDESGDSVMASAIAVLVVVLVAGVMGLLNLCASRLPKGVIPWHD
ncbi:ABC transporter permease [Marinomonas posidonica]|uniref:ABC-type transporter, integral membrane subunit n=1 Tax=Marinomonas posidonica (strain CECT 7376 / NCIMB 14433 / IVIA-Po-181) TaxID=491952 RepID=F6CVV4_MARPP|nr:iron ABC transporter permease [Marinomonas posidonica]AEF53162.1 ABC-type transporter, integral membrane subunit [Marinomonas posidonica IVIA-Po-181]